MNIFIIPSWYPSPNDPIIGIFFREQAQAIAELYPNFNVGVSVWGQSDEQYLLWLRDSFKNITKITNSFKKLNQSTLNQAKSTKNFHEFYHFAFTWSKKIWRGNIAQIIKANKKNFEQFTQKFGKPDIIHAQIGYPGGYVAHILSEYYGIPYVVTEQMGPFPFADFLDKNNELFAPLKIAYQKSKKNIAISPQLAEKMALKGVQNLVYIPNLVNDNLFTSITQKQEENTNTTKVFTFFTLSRMVAGKGIPDLLLAIAEVMKSNPNVCFKMGGNGEELADYQKIAKDLEIENYIEWLGLLDREQSKQAFQSCDAFVLASHHETMGVVYAEAIACGKPTIGTICGGPESIINEQNGFLVEVQNIKQLSQKMIEMIDNYHLFSSEVIRQDFEKRFSKKAVCRQIVDLYASII